jgi:hypothetical protein
MSTSPYDPDDDTEFREADPADVAEQSLPADPSIDPDGEAALGGIDDDLPEEADPADVAEQRREVPSPDPYEEP